MACVRRFSVRLKGDPNARYVRFYGSRENGLALVDRIHKSGKWGNVEIKDVSSVRVAMKKQTITDTLPEYITAAAIHYKGQTFSMPAPARHVEVMWMCDAIFTMQDRHDDYTEKHISGFVTSHCRFVNRKEALKIAINAMQVSHPLCDELYSEDLW